VVIYNLFNVYICSTPSIDVIDYFNLQNEQGKIGLHLLLLKWISSQYLDYVSWLHATIRLESLLNKLPNFVQQTFISWKSPH
jgi:hypothetical protein